MNYYFTLDPDSPRRWVRTDKRGKVSRHGDIDTEDATTLPSKDEHVIGIAPGDRVVVHLVDIPSRRRNKVEAAIPFALEESLTEDIETTHFTLLEWEPGVAAKVAVVAKKQINLWLEQSAALNIRVDAIVPDYLLLATHPQAQIAVVHADDNKILIRSSRSQGMAIDRDTVSYWWEDLDNKDLAIAVNDAEIARELIAADGSRISEWPMGREIHHWLTESDKDLEDFNLLHSELVPGHRVQKRTGLKIAAVIAALAIGLKLGADGAEYNQLKQQNRKQKRAIVSMLVSNFPHVKRIVDPKIQLRREIETLRGLNTGSGDFQSLLMAVAQVVPQNQGTVEELVFKDNSLFVICNVRDFSLLERIKSAFERQQGLAIELLSSSANEDSVNGRFKLSSRT